MFGDAGHLYVYRSYGMHFCANVSYGPDGVAGGVLLRAAEVESGHDRSASRRTASATAGRRAWSGQSRFRTGSVSRSQRFRPVRPRSGNAAGTATGGRVRERAAGGYRGGGGPSLASVAPRFGRGVGVSTQPARTDAHVTVG